ncbi:MULTISPECIES: hypothetical protein [Sphingobium]|jgi:hypothetical protein|uniref:hypothetical protein n=1 Tax=Sphingobium TaxID=165695 RepID=UPI00257EB8C1|nr:hypothetical protein [Sphingobium sp.]
MCVLITPISESVRLRVTGDVETVLAVPYENDDRFLVGLSDGTLLMGFFGKDMRCRWEVLAMVRDSFISKAMLPVSSGASNG